jgi:hypothetical protein
VATGSCRLEKSIDDLCESGRGSGRSQFRGSGFGPLTELGPELGTLGEPEERRSERGRILEAVDRSRPEVAPGSLGAQRAPPVRRTRKADDRDATEDGMNE